MTGSPRRHAREVLQDRAVGRHPCEANARHGERLVGRARPHAEPAGREDDRICREPLPGGQRNDGTALVLLDRRRPRLVYVEGHRRREQAQGALVAPHEVLPVQRAARMRLGPDLGQLGLVRTGSYVVAQRSVEAPRPTGQVLPHGDAPLVQGGSTEHRSRPCVRLVGEQRHRAGKGVHAQLAWLVRRPDLAGARLELLDEVQVATLRTAARKERAEELDADHAARAEAHDDQ